MLTRSLFTRLMMVALIGLTVTACSKKEDEAGAPVVTNEGIGQGGLTGAEGMDGQGMAGVDGQVVPGSQQDLVVNVGDRVFFGYDRHDLAPEALATLGKQAEWLNRYPNLNVTIEGHADERGTREYNIALGDRRANSVKSYLISMGVSPTRLNTISYGKEQPAVLGANPAGWAQNRRAVTRVE
jgi:peptidoglycan-associated lipoprotein